MVKCDFCGEKEGNKSCSICKHAIYCSLNCQKSHWSKHKKRCQPFSIQSIASKGKGLIANRKIKFGETIVTERPIFVLKNSQFSDFDSWCIEVVNLVKNLPQEKLRKYLDLADNDYFNKTSEFLYLKGVKKKSEEFLQYIRILRTNGINIDENGEKTGVFHIFSRINHSCGPNSVRNINSEETGEMSVIATREIEKGEEILIKYFDLEAASLMRDQRRLKLLNWGFKCNCDICDLPEADLQKNESLRKQLKVTKDALKKCPTDPFDLQSLRKQLTIEKITVKILSDLKSQLIGELPDHLMSLHHVGKLLRCHGQEVPEDLDKIKSEAFNISTHLGPAFLNQYLYWDNLTNQCCNSVLSLES